MLMYFDSSKIIYLFRCIKSMIAVVTFFPSILEEENMRDTETFVFQVFIIEVPLIPIAFSGV